MCDTFQKARQAEVLREVGKEDFDENTRRGRCVPIVDLDALKSGPRESVREEEMGEQASHVAEAVVLVTMDCFVSFRKKVLELRLIVSINITESLGHETVELEVGTFLGAALNDHAANVID